MNFLIKSIFVLSLVTVFNFELKANEAEKKIDNK